MKANIHPDYHEITVKLTNGETFQTYSTYGKAGDVLQLDVDTTTHPAWTGGVGKLDQNKGKLAQFNNKFAGLSFGAKKQEEN